jgi:HEPN domain-containing protein
MPQLLGDDWKDWLSYAKTDKDEAYEAYKRGSWREVCFHSQQSCEKLLKGIMLRMGIFLPIHDLKQLAKEISNNLADLYQDLGELTKHYYCSRYPNAARRLGIEYDKKEAFKCLKIMEKLWKRLKERLR